MPERSNGNQANLLKHIQQCSEKHAAAESAIREMIGKHNEWIAAREVQDDERWTTTWRRLDRMDRWKHETDEQLNRMDKRFLVVVVLVSVGAMGGPFVGGLLKSLLLG